MSFLSWFFGGSQSDNRDRNDDKQQAWRQLTTDASMAASGAHLSATRGRSETEDALLETDNDNDHKPKS